MLAQVKVRPVVDALDFLKTNREVIGDIVGILRIMGKLVVVVPLEVLLSDTVLEIEGPAVLPPVLKNRVVASRLAEVLHLHLLKLAGAEDEILEDDFIAEGLTDLGDSKGKLHAVGLDDVLEICEDALAGLRAQVNQVAVIGNRSLISLEHKVELANRSILALLAATSRTVDVRIDESLHLLMAHRIDGLSGSLVGMGVNEILDELVGTEAGLALSTVNHRVREVGDVARSLPSLVVLENSGIQTDNIIAQLGHVVPPGILDVALKLDAEGTIVPGTGLTAINLARLIDKSPPLAEADNLVQRTTVVNFLFCHRSKTPKRRLLECNGIMIKIFLPLYRKKNFLPRAGSLRNKEKQLLPLDKDFHLYYNNHHYMGH